MKILGSNPSPYVRRIRMWLDESDFEFVPQDYLSPEGRALLKQSTPAMKVPVLIDGDKTLYDSRVIYNYLNEKLQRESLDWDQQNNLTLIDAVNDSFVVLLLMARSGLDNSGDVLIADLQRGRIAETLSVLEAKVADGEFTQWEYPAVCLYCLIDWAIFRELYDFSAYPQLMAFHGQQTERECVKRTDPR